MAGLANTTQAKKRSRLKPQTGSTQIELQKQRKCQFNKLGNTPNTRLRETNSQQIQTRLESRAPRGDMKVLRTGVILASVTHLSKVDHMAP